MAIKFLSDINAEGSATDINADGVIKIKDTTILETNATYTMLSDPEGSRKIYLGDGGDRTNYYDNNSHRFRGHGGSGEKMFINSSGQIGIGTTSPASGYKLDIQGAVISNQSFRARGVETGNPQPVADNAHLSGYGIIGNRGTFYVTNNGTVQIGNGTVHNANPAASYTSSSITHYRPTTITSSGYIDFKVDQTDSAAIKMGVSSASTEGFIMTETTGGSHLSTDPVLKFLYNDGTATEYARFTTSGLDVTGRLDVASDLRLRGEGSTLDAGVARLYVDSNNAINIDAGNNGSDIVQIQSDGDMIVPGKMQIGANEVIYSDGSITMAIDVNNNETDRAFTVAQGSSYASLFRVQENGNVGIGTTSPTAKLQVGGGTSNSGSNTAMFSGDGTGIFNALSLVNRVGGQNGRGVRLSFHNNSNWSATGAIQTVQTNGTEAALVFMTYNSNLSEKMRVASNGNVGIGTTSPSEKLEVYSATDNVGIKIRQNGGTAKNPYILMDGESGRAGYLRMSTDGTAASQMNFYASDDASSRVWSINENANFGDATADIMLMQNGNVGIGTTSPTERLEVYDGSIKLNDGTRNLLIGEEGGSSYQIKSSGYLIVDATSGIQINKTTSGNVTVASGNVGIGTTSPSAKLHVAGAIKTTGDVTMSSNTTLHIGNVDLTTGSGGNTVSVECATSSGTAMNFKTSGGTVGAYMMYQGTTTTRFAGRVEPSGNRTLDLGTDALRWRVLYCETLDSAGQHESNLQDREQPVGQYITGTVLSWKDGKNRPCTNFADHMRMGIAVLGQDSPLVQGAEPVLCTGIVEEGDYLVTSEKEGHAVAIPRHIVKEQLLFDCVIGKALQGGEGESHLIKTWINI